MKQKQFNVEDLLKDQTLKNNYDTSVWILGLLALLFSSNSFENKKDGINININIGSDK